MRIAICENNKMMLENVERMVRQYDFKKEMILDTFCDGNSLLQTMKEKANDPYDIVLIDLCPPDPGEGERMPDGIDAAKKMKHVMPACLVIYMSSYYGFIINLVQAGLFTFLHKPFKPEELFQMFDDYMERKRILKNMYFSYTFSGKAIEINLNDVVYFYSKHGTVHILFRNGDEKYYYEKLNNVEEKLLKMGAFFLRISKSYIVNKIFIEEGRFDQILICGKELSVTEKYREEYYQYMAGDRYF